MGRHFVTHLPHYFLLDPYTTEKCSAIKNTAVPKGELSFQIFSLEGIFLANISAEKWPQYLLGKKDTV